MLFGTRYGPLEVVPMEYGIAGMLQLAPPIPVKGVLHRF